MRTIPWCRALVTACSLALLLGCEADYQCGPLQYDPARGVCGCPDGTEITEDYRACVLPDGGLISLPDESIPDAAVDASHDAGEQVDASADACAMRVFYRDQDGDGSGDPAATTSACDAPPGYVADGTDCDDSCAACRPGGVEVCEGTRDEDCVGGVDDGCACTAGSVRPCPGGTDVGECEAGTQSCVGGSWAACTGAIAPEAEECNGRDDDCDEALDEGVTTTWYRDADGDGYGVDTTTMEACDRPAGYSATAADCDDTLGTVNPGAPEQCNGRSDDCDAASDETFACVLGAATICTTSCGSSGTGTCTGACTVPTDDACSPPSESCNGADDDCDLFIDERVVMGAPVATDVAAGTSGVAIVPTAAGAWRAFWISGSQIFTRAVTSSGAGSGTTATIVSTGVSGDFVDARASDDGASIVVVYGTSSGDLGYVVVSPTSAALQEGPATFYDGSSVVYARIVHVGAGDVIAYVADGSYSVVRARRRLGGTTSSSIVDVNYGPFFDVTRDPESGREFIVYLSATSPRAVEARVVTPNTSSASVGPAVPIVTVAAGAIRYPVISAVGANGLPDGIAWAEIGGGFADYRLRFASMRSVPSWEPAYYATVGAGTTPGPTSTGHGDDLRLARWGGRFLLTAIVRQFGESNSDIRAWEIIQGASSASVRELTTPTALLDNAARRGHDTRIAVDGSRARVIFERADGQLSTFSLGCP